MYKRQDVAKAFDTVDNVILLDKLWKVGFRRIPYEWLRSYLLNRRQVVCIGSSISSEGTVMYGLPQGSVLGLILYLIYSNDLCEGRFRGQVTESADDTALLYVYQQNFGFASQLFQLH